MKRIVLASAAAIILLCIFNQTLEAIVGVSAFFLIAAVAVVMALVTGLGPWLSAARDGGIRYENRLVRRPGH